MECDSLYDFLIVLLMPKVKFKYHNHFRQCSFLAISFCTTKFTTWFYHLTCSKISDKVLSNTAKTLRGVGIC